MLKALLLRKKINEKKAELEKLRAKDAELVKREAELENDIKEAQTEEEQKAVEEAVEAFQADKAANDAAVADLDKQVSDLENELAECETEPTGKPAPEEKTEEKPEERKVVNAMNTRSRFFGLTFAERDAMIARSDVKEFLTTCRTAMQSQFRGVSNAGLTIPQVLLDLLRENMGEYSKLYKHVAVKRVSGTSRVPIQGAIPEGVWTEAIGVLNEVTLAFSGFDFDGYKVGSYIPVPNCYIEDSDVNLATIIMEAIAAGLGLAVDKAILYGTGTKMPLGIVTRLAQTQAPADYPAKAPTWLDLHSTNIVTISANNSTGANLFKNIVKAFGAAKSNYSNGSKFFAMNETTKTTLIAEAITFNAAGALVAGVNNEMPAIGGAIETLSFIPDNVIIGGYGDLYVLAERAGVQLGQSEHVKFIEDQTVMRATARYDGRPVIAEGFVAIGISATTPTANAVTFAADTANASAAG